MRALKRGAGVLRVGPFHGAVLEDAPGALARTTRLVESRPHHRRELAREACRAGRVARLTGRIGEQVDALELLNEPLGIGHAVRIFAPDLVEGSLLGAHVLVGVKHQQVERQARIDDVCARGDRRGSRADRRQLLIDEIAEEESFGPHAVVQRQRETRRARARRRGFGPHPAEKHLQRRRDR